MKNIYNLITIVSVFCFVGCKTVKTDKIKPYTRLDSITVSNQMKEFSIEVPKTWYSYLGSHRSLTHSPIQFELNEGKNSIAILDISKQSKKRCKCNNISDLTAYFIENQKKIYKNFQYDIVKAKHPIYDRYNFIIYKRKFLSGERTVLNALIFREDFYYKIRFTASNKQYKRYATDVVKMIHSFKIK